MSQLEKAILKTLCYGDVFDYPLDLSELHRFLIAPKPVSYKIIAKLLRSYPNSNIEKNQGLYFLKGRKKIVRVRKQRERWAQLKWRIAQRVASWLRLVPTVRMVALSGALARNNAQKEDDIDFLIVTSRGRLWTTRFLVTLLVELVACRRRPGEKEVKDKICLNMFLDEDHLAIPKKEQDLFSAYEVAQVRVLWERGEIYRKFLFANRWVSNYLGNFGGGLKRGDITKLRYYDIKKKNKNKKTLNILISQYLNIFFNFFETFLRSFQLWYMKKRRSSEVIRKGYLRFHPEDARSWVLRKYSQSLRKITKNYKIGF